MPKSQLNEGLNIVLTENGFDVFCMLPDVDDEEISHWHTDEMSWGIYYEKRIVFFLLDSGEELLLAVGFNIRELKSKRLFAWFETPVRQIRILLIEKRTREILSIRNIQTNKETEHQIKKQLRLQYAGFNSKVEIDEAITNREKKYTPQIMFKIAARHSCVWKIVR